MTFACIKARISANTITFISLICAVIGAFLQSYSDFKILGISSFFLILYFLLDMVDGELARYNAIVLKNKNGKSGAYFDAYVHYILTPILFLSLGIFSYHEYNSEWFIWLGLWVGMWLSSYSQSAAYRVIFDSILNGSEKDSDSIRSIWLHDKFDRRNIRGIQIFRFIVREIFSSQGQIYCIIIAILFDYLFAPYYSFRTLYLIFMGLFAAYSMPKVFIKFYKQLKNID